MLPLSADPDPAVVLYIGAGWDVEAVADVGRVVYEQTAVSASAGSVAQADALAQASPSHFIYVDSIPSRFLYWRPGEVGYELARSLDLIVGVLRYKLAIVGAPVVTEERFPAAAVGTAGAAAVSGPVVVLTLASGARLTYFFDTLFPDDFPALPASGCCDGSDGGGGGPPRTALAQPTLLQLLPHVTSLFMKGFAPKPISLLLKLLPSLRRIYTTADNYGSMLRGLGATAESTDDDVEAALRRGCNGQINDPRTPQQPVAAALPPGVVVFTVPDFDVQTVLRVARAPTRAHTHPPTPAPARTHARTSARMHARARTYTRTRTHTRTHARAHARTHARTHPPTHTLTQTHRYSSLVGGAGRPCSDVFICSEMSRFRRGSYRLHL